MGINANEFGYTWTPAHELSDAITGGLLTQEEARTIYWSQFSVLRNQASVTPPAIDTKP
jgi:hypothetical protein